MSKGKVQIIYGTGKGKSSSALGYAIKEASHEGSVVVVEFLKKKDTDEMNFLSRLEPEIRIFRFQKSGKEYEELSESEKSEERGNMINALSFVHKVLVTGECSKLILDEMLGLADCGIVSEEKLIEILDQRPEGMEIILTGRVLGDRMRDYADEIFEIRTEKSC